MRRPDNTNNLTEVQRGELVELLLDATLNNQFGDGQERDMVLHGTTFKGLYNYTDAELVEEGDAIWVWEDEDTRPNY